MNLDMNALMSMAKVMGTGGAGEKSGGGTDMMSMLMNMMGGNKPAESDAYAQKNARPSDAYAENYGIKNNFAAANGLGVLNEQKNPQQPAAPAQDFASMLPMLMGMFNAPKAKAAAVEEKPTPKTEKKENYGGKNPQFFYDKIKRRPQNKVTGFSAVKFAGYELMDSLKKLKSALSSP